MNEAQRDDFAGRKVAAMEMQQKVDEALTRKRYTNQLKWYEDESKKRMLTKEEL
jgi:hypothetical protein